MSKTASIALAPSSHLFARLFAAVDRWLMAYAETQIRMATFRASASKTRRHAR